MSNAHLNVKEPKDLQFLLPVIAFIGDAFCVWPPAKNSVSPPNVSDKNPHFKTLESTMQDIEYLKTGHFGAILSV